MKKYLCWMVVMTLTLILVTSSASASMIVYTNEIGDVKTTPVSIADNGENVTVSVSAVKSGDQEEDLTFIMTAYNKDTKRLEIARMLTQTVGSTPVVFTFENVNVTENHEINVSLVSLTENFMPRSVPLIKPVKDEAVNLRDIKINGVSVIDNLDEENTLTHMITKRMTEEGEYVEYTYDELEEMVVPYTVDAGSTVELTNVEESPYSQILTVTDINGNTKEYTINYVYPLHVVSGAIADEDFESKTTKWYDETYGSKNVVASKALGGDGILYKNLHPCVIVDNTVDANCRGSVPFTNYFAVTSTNWVLKEINDEDAIGADFFAFETNKGSGGFGSVTYDGTNALNTLEDGAEWVKFNTDYSARVTLYTTVDAISAYEADGWTGEINKEAPYIVCDRTDKFTTGSHIAKYTCKVYKDFPAGEVVINYHSVISNNARAPFITVKH